MHAIHMIAWQIMAQDMAQVESEMYSEPVQSMSMLGWVYQALGPMYGLLLPMLGMLVFAGAILVVVKNRRPADIASFIYFAAAPLVFGMFGVVHGMIASFQVIATSGSTPKPSDLAMGISMALFSAMFGMLCSFPAYGVLGLGYLVRTLTLKDSPQTGKP